MAEMKMDDILATIGFGCIQTKLIIGCSLQHMYVANELIGISIVTVMNKCDLEIDHIRLSWLVSSTFCAMMISTYFMGFKSDESGRRKVMMISSSLSIITSFISSLMPEYWSFAFMRVLHSLFITGPGVAITSYIGEMVQISQRPITTVITFVSLGISMLYTSGVAYMLQPQVFGSSIEAYAWRIQIIISLLPGLISLLIVSFLPESPKYYLSVGKPELAMQSLEAICRGNRGKSVTLESLGIKGVYQPRQRTDFTAPSHLIPRMWHETLPMFQWEILRPLLYVCIIMFLFFATGYCLTIWKPQIFQMTVLINDDQIMCYSVMNAIELNLNNTEIQCQISEWTLIAFFLMGITSIFMFLLMAMLLFFFNRQDIIAFFTIVSASGGFALNYLNDIHLICGSFMLFALPSMCSIRLITTVLIDAIPTHYRTKAVSMSMICGRLGTMSASWYLGHMLANHCVMAFNTFVGALLFIFFLILLMPQDMT